MHQPHAVPAFSNEEAQQIYNAGLDAAANVAQASISQQNRQRRQQLMQERSAFLSAMPYGHSVKDCMLEDLLVYLQQVYIPCHAGSVLPSIPCIAAPTTIVNVLSHLRMIFKEIGRGTEWDDHHQCGNPAAAHQISQWSQGLTKVSCAAGFRTTGAVPMK